MCISGFIYSPFDLGTERWLFKMILFFTKFGLKKKISSPSWKLKKTINSQRPSASSSLPNIQNITWGYEVWA